MLKILRFVTLTAFLGLGTVHGQNVVQGKVLNFDGEPAINSSVEAFPIRDGGFAGDLTWTKVTRATRSCVELADDHAPAVTFVARLHRFPKPKESA